MKQRGGTVDGFIVFLIAAIIMVFIAAYLYNNRSNTDASKAIELENQQKAKLETLTTKLSNVERFIEDMRQWNMALASRCSKLEQEQVIIQTRQTTLDKKISGVNKNLNLTINDGKPLEVVNMPPPIHPKKKPLLQRAGVTK